MSFIVLIIDYRIFYLQLAETKLNLEGLEKERDFYFGKLRDIEIYCQEQDAIESNPLLQKVLEILYATEVSTTILYFI